MDDTRRAALLTRRAIIAFVIIEAIAIFGSIGITLLRQQPRTDATTTLTR